MLLRPVCCLIATLALAGCASDGSGAQRPVITPTPTSSTTSTTTTTVATTLAPTTSTSSTTTTTAAATTTTVAATTTLPATTVPETAPPTTVPPPTVPNIVPTIDPTPPIATQLDMAAPQLLLGNSIEGRPIIADRIGEVGGRRVLVIGVIHGNEDAGVQIIDELRVRGPREGIELWLVESMNPDGQAAQDRQNANEVDLNRNFPHEWGPIGEVGNSQYAGSGPASEPETQAMVNFIGQLRPDIALWYHQDANLVIPSTGRDGRIRARYAELTGLPIADCCGGGGVYTGIAATWARNELKRDSDAVAFIVELPGGELSPEQVAAHATAVLTIGAEG